MDLSSEPRPRRRGFALARLARLVSPSLAAVGVALLVLDARPGLGWAALISALAVGAAFGGRR